jgi:hypothetical protein
MLTRPEQREPSWLQLGFPPSEDLPFVDEEFVPAEKGTEACAVAGWKQHFASCGVTRADIDLYPEQIDRPFSKDQRRELCASARVGSRGTRAKYLRAS